MEIFTEVDKQALHELPVIASLMEERVKTLERQLVDLTAKIKELEETIEESKWQRACGMADAWTQTAAAGHE